MTSFRSFWDSERDRIGDAYPNAGWDAWEEEEESRRRREKARQEAAAAAANDLAGSSSVDILPAGGRRRAKSGGRKKASDFFFDKPTSSHAVVFDDHAADSGAPLERKINSGGGRDINDNGFTDAKRSSLTATEPEQEGEESKPREGTASPPSPSPAPNGRTPSGLVAAFEAATGKGGGSTSSSTDDRDDDEEERRERREAVERESAVAASLRPALELARSAAAAAARGKKESPDATDDDDDGVAPPEPRRSTSSDGDAAASASSFVDRLAESGQVIAPAAAVASTKTTSSSKSKSGDDGNGIVTVYSLVHRRRIDVAKEELTADATRNSLRRALRTLREDRRRRRRQKMTATKYSDGVAAGTDEDDGVSGRFASVRSRSATASRDGATMAVVTAVDENDPFLSWGIRELAATTTESPDVVFAVPLRSVVDRDLVRLDPHRTILYEDGIEDVVVPYLSSFFDDDAGMSALIAACLRFLGVIFPRSTSVSNEFYEPSSGIFPHCGDGGSTPSDLRKGGDGLAACLDGIFEPSSASATTKSDEDGSSFFPFDAIRGQIRHDESVVAFDPDLFERRNRGQRRFVRTVLHDLVASLEGNREGGDGNGGGGSSSSRASSSSSWRAHVAIALMSFEARAAGPRDGDRARAIAKGLLSGTEAGRSDPRLWLAYARLEGRFEEDVDDDGGGGNNPRSKRPGGTRASKILSNALGASAGRGSTDGASRRGWLELSVAAVRAAIGLPMRADGGDLSRRPTVASDEARDRCLHVLCCAVEGTYVPVPKVKAKKRRKRDDDGVEDRPSAPPLAPPSRLLKCRSMLRKRLADARSSKEEGEEERAGGGGDDNCADAHPADRHFDPTPSLYHYGEIAAWLEALTARAAVGPEGTVDFAAGAAVLDDWIDALTVGSAPTLTEPLKLCLMRWSNLKLEFVTMPSLRGSVPGSGSADRKFAFELLRDVLMPSAVSLTNRGCVPPTSHLLATAAAEALFAERLPLSRGYFSLCADATNRRPRRDLFSREVAFLLARAVFASEREAVQERRRLHVRRTIATDDDDDEAATPINGTVIRCARWTPDGCRRTKDALRRAVDSSGWGSSPPLLRSLIRLELLGGTARRRRDVRRGRASFASAKYEHDRGLTRCLHSKGLWLDAFTVLRPAFGEHQMLALMAALERTDLRLVNCLEDVDVS